MPTKKQQKNIWCKPTEIPQNTIFMMSAPVRFFLQEWPKRGLGDKITKYFSLYKGDFCEMCYLRHEFDEEAEFLADKMIKKPDWAIRVANQVIDWSTKLFTEAKILLKLKMNGLSDNDLIRYFNRVLKYQTLSHGVGPAISWHADVEKERVTRAILEIIDKQIKSRSLKLSAPVVLSLLSTPKKTSIIEHEEMEFLKIAQEIYKQKKLCKIFGRSDLEWLEKELKNINKGVYKKIIRHYKKYAYIPYQYKGPAYSLADFLGRWQALTRKNTQPNKMMSKIKLNRDKLIRKQKQLLAKLKFNNYQFKLIKLAQKLVYLKDYRKMALYYAMYSYEPLFKEVGRRLGLSLEQVRAMNSWEIPEALLKKEYDVNEINQRLKFAVGLGR